MSTLRMAACKLGIGEGNIPDPSQDISEWGQGKLISQQQKQEQESVIFQKGDC